MRPSLRQLCFNRERKAAGRKTKLNILFKSTYDSDLTSIRRNFPYPGNYVSQRLPCCVFKVKSSLSTYRFTTCLMKILLSLYSQCSKSLCSTTSICSSTIFILVGQLSRFSPSILSLLLSGCCPPDFIPFFFFFLL